MKASLLTAGGIGLAMIAVSSIDRRPTLVWNATASAPIGLYRIVASQPSRGSLALIILPEPFRTLLDRRGYLRASLPMLKPVAAAHGDSLCRLGSAVFINGRLVALAHRIDHAARPLPRWRGCQHLGNAVAVISQHPYGFDSRYFGALDLSAVIGLAIPIWTTAQTPLRLPRH
jgi:conjugative transfer signal peptidase TraF